MREWTIPLPYPGPPLSLNDRRSWQARHRITKQVRRDACLLARANRIPALDRCCVQLLYAPPDRRRRDDDNLTATLKPLCDGLVDAGIVPDDTVQFMVKPSPRLVAAPRPRAQLWLLVTELPPAGAGT